MATDYYLTVFAYRYPWHTSAYLITWVWYAAVVVLGCFPALLQGWIESFYLIL